MGDTNFRGPLVSMGSLEIEAGTQATIEPMDGPSAFYQAWAMPDPRGTYAKDGTSPGRNAGFLANADFWAVDSRPQAANATTIATNQVATSLLAMTLQTAQPSNPNAGCQFMAIGVPILAQGTSNITTALIALDFGFVTGTATANSSTMSVSDNTKLTVGQWICIGGGNTSNTASFFTQVQSITTSNTTGITVVPLPPASGSSAPIGGANIFGAGLYPPPTQFGPSAVVASYISPNTQAGVMRVHNPVEMNARNISITLATGGVATAVNFLVSGWDVWRMPMTELIQSPATTSATVTYGQKAFKYIAAIVPQSASTGGNSYSVGFGDVFGCPFRADEWEQTNSFWAGTASANSTGFTTAVVTSPATNTTGDVRGAFQVSGAGRGTAITGTAASNGTARFALIQNVGVWNVITCNPLNTPAMFGVTQSIT